MIAQLRSLEVVVPATAFNNGYIAKGEHAYTQIEFASWSLKIIPYSVKGST